ncbi:MAG: FixG Ig-like domain-containing protein [Nanobdellota archaeon]
MEGKRIGLLVMMIAALMLASSAALALPNVEYIKINGDKFSSGDKLVVEKGDNLEIRVKMNSSMNESDVEMHADLIGYEYNDIERISDATHLFDIDAGDTVYKNLEVRIPENTEKDEYDLRVRVATRTGPSDEYTFPIEVEGARHALRIKDVLFSPENEVVSGRAMLATVRVENLGEHDEDSVKVRVRIPSLGLSASDYIDEIEEGEKVTSEELYLRIPSCTEGGIYTVEVEVTYDEGYEKVTEESTIRIVTDESCYAPEEDESEEKTIISVGSTNMDVVKGESGAVYPITISNSGTQSRTYSLSVDGVSGWGTSKVTPANSVVLAAGETKALYVYISADETATEGERMFSVEVNSDSKVLKQIPLKAQVVQGEDGAATSWDRVRNGLEIGLIVLVVLLVLLGLIVGFNKLRGDKGDEDQTYY